METKIFGRLTAWQNWIFQRPNAVGKNGALSLYRKRSARRFRQKTRLINGTVKECIHDQHQLRRTYPQ